MKSYLKFLSRNKLYTAIEAAGLIVSLAFVVIITCYVWQQFAVTRETPDYKRVYSLNMGSDWLSAYPGEMSMVRDRVPDIESSARMNTYVTSVIFNDNRIPGHPDICEIDPEFFDFFPQEFLEGSEDALKDRNQVILGEAFSRKISPDFSPMGKTIIVNKDTCTIGGILKIKDNSLLKEQDIYKPFKGPDEPSTSEFIIPVDLVLIKFREGADHEAARTLIDTLVRQEFSDAFSVNKPEYRMTVPVKEIYFSKRNAGYEFKSGNPTLVYVLIAVGILLLVSAIFNYINLSVALAGKRAKEMAIRSTLGESRRRITWRYISEAIIFITICMFFALLLARWLEPVFNKYVAGDIGLKVAYSFPYIAVYSLLIIIIGVISGLVPALMTFRHDPVAIIKGEQRRQTKTVLSKVFIIIQNVITVALISMALVMELQYNHLVNMPLGANVNDLYFISAGNGWKDQLAMKPYVERIGTTRSCPGIGNMSIGTTVDGQKLMIGVLQCDETAFDMFGFEVVKDFGVPKNGSIWLTESAARIYSVDENNPKSPDVMNLFWGEHEVGGIIKDYAVKGPSEIKGNQIGVVAVDKMEKENEIVLKLNRFDSEVRAELKEIGRQESIRMTGDENYASRYGLVTELIEKSLEKTHNFIRLIELFMLLATIISLLGLVAMSAYYAGMQTKDIAVRKVFGGTIASETRRAVIEYMVMVGIAIIIGIPLAIFLAERYLRQFWYRIDHYGWVFIVAVVLTLVISFLAVLWQTLHAARTNPAEELKKE